MSYYDEVKSELKNLLDELGKSGQKFDDLFRRLEEEHSKIEQARLVIRQMAKERQIGFPILAKAYDDFFELQDKQLIDFLKYKDKPAIRAADIVQAYGKIRRAALKDKKIAEYLVEYYESIAPFLIDLKEEVSDISEEDRILAAEYSAEELGDTTTQFLTKEEYRKLTSTARNQLALDRYWKRPKSKWHIGKLYERYVGYLFEAKGYDVDYVGIFKGFEDLGRDIIAKKDNEIIVIQCKNWSKFRTIYEKHIFQFFGTVFQYRDENKGKEVKAIFYTTTTLSDLARRFANELKIELKENEKMDKDYPCVKCNISRVDGTKIYHLPFDQQYDNTKIETKKGEFYCATIAEAEEQGFRRAFKYKGINKEESS
ncbi:restriction endonuclease [Patescibacteria group bacterium]|nr:restriction endonuclease [Patescibacteria group bacterium]